MEVFTMGVNAVVRSVELVRLKYSVSAVSLPVRILRASSKDIFFNASRKICFAWGAACSAARFMPTSSSSTLAPMPAANAFQFRRQQNLDRCVLQEAIGLAR